MYIIPKNGAALKIYAPCDCNNNLSVYLKKDLENKHDFFD